MENLDLHKLSTQDKIKAFAEAKEKLNKIKELVNIIQAELFLDTQKLGFDTLGSKENGQVTVVYKTNYIFDPEVQNIINNHQVEITNIKEKIKEVENTAKSLNKAKEDKEFSYIKYSKPSKKHEVK